MTDQSAPSPSGADQVLDFHRAFAAAYARLARVMRARLRQQNVDQVAMERIVARMHQHVIRSGMASSTNDLEDIVAVLLVRLLVLETKLHSKR